MRLGSADEAGDLWSSKEPRTHAPVIQKPFGVINSRKQFNNWCASHFVPRALPTWPSLQHGHHSFSSFYRLSPHHAHDHTTLRDLPRTIMFRSRKPLSRITFGE